MARPRGRTHAGARRREQILAQTETLVEAHGFDELTMESVAESLGVAKSTLYHYFPQKQDMLFALHRQTLTEQISLLTSIAMSPESANERLQRAVLEQVRLIAEHPGRVKVLRSSKGDPSYRREIAGLERAYLEAFVSLVAAGIAEGGGSTVDPLIAARVILGAIQQTLYWMTAEDLRHYERVAEQIWSVLRDGVMPNRALDGWASLDRLVSDVGPEAEAEDGSSHVGPLGTASQGA